MFCELLSCPGGSGMFLRCPHPVLPRWHLRSPRVVFNVPLPEDSRQLLCFLLAVKRLYCCKYFLCTMALICTSLVSFQALTWRMILGFKAGFGWWSLISWRGFWFHFGFCSLYFFNTCWFHKVSKSRIWRDPWVLHPPVCVQSEPPVGSQSRPRGMLLESPQGWRTCSCFASQ